MALVTYTCPHCGATLSIPQGTKRAVCEYCDSEILVEGARRESKSAGAAYRPKTEPEPERRQNTETTYSYGGQNQNTAYSEGYTQGNSFGMVSPKSRMAALLLCVFIGIFGIHRFYVGKIGTGLLFFFTFSLLGFGYIYDIIMIATGYFKDANGLYLKNW